MLKSRGTDGRGESLEMNHVHPVHRATPVTTLPSCFVGAWEPGGFIKLVV